MKILFEDYELSLRIGDKNFPLSINKEQSKFFGCKYILSPMDDEEIFFDVVEHLSGTGFAKNVCIESVYESDTYPYSFFAMVGRAKNQLQFAISYSYRLDDWDEPANLNHFLPKLMKQLELGQYYEVTLEDDYADGMQVITLHFTESLETSLHNAATQACKYMLNAHNLVLSGLVEEDGFISQFRFPPEYKAAFIQYLTYFGKFLEDLGIAGDLSIKTRNEITYLTFHPENKDIALENIAIALSAYLSFPSEEHIPFFHHDLSPDAKINSHQLHFVIETLKSQLRYAEAAISLKNLEISLLKNRESGKEKPMPQVSSDIKDYWEPIEGFKIIPYRGKFFEANFPKLWKGIRKKVSDLFDPDETHPDSMPAAPFHRKPIEK